MIDKLDTNQPMIESSLSSGQSKPPKAIPNNHADVSIQVNYAALIDEAVQEPKGDAQRLERARELLLSGQLESPESIREAAENIVKYGI
ncbi:MAG: hypothetical protein AMJ65_06350 [Phycisphaerae bacterium SG8_4]|nr:MAG: hypothetical protein AMJ65_06350 [Phycisphaerae bacterium SG8_4]